SLYGARADQGRAGHAGQGCRPHHSKPAIQQLHRQQGPAEGILRT
ncbi:hypothetical protein ATR1_054c0001, partial [Acetobacter tropicalis]